MGKTTVKDVEKQLKNIENYTNLSRNSNTANESINTQIISKFQKEILSSKNVSDELKTENSNTPHLFLEPKTYREGNPGGRAIN